MQYVARISGGFVLGIALFAIPAFCQINGVPSSVTSPGFGGRAINGTAPSVTSLGPNGFTPQARGGFVPANQRRDNFDHNGRHRRHERRDSIYAVPYAYALPVPYGVDNGQALEQTDQDEDEYQGGPTIFDRRGAGASSYIPPVQEVPKPHAAESAGPVSDPGPPQQPTLLVFQDGHKQEVVNYAIVGQTLFDLTPGHARKIALADLNLPATQQENDNRGITFQLPPQGN